MSRQTELESAFVKPLRDADRIVDRISELTHESPAEVRRRLKIEYNGLGTNVREALRAKNIPPYVWSEQLERFYERTDAFLYETIVWNLTYAKCELRIWISEYLHLVNAPKSVLTYGDGLGFDSWFLASQGHDVTYFEVSQPCAEFATAIFRDDNLSVDVITEPKQIENQQFDTIVCLDVLEHVPDPCQLVQWLSSRLRPNGRLIVSAPFYLINTTVQTHLRSNQHFSGDYRQLYEQARLTPVNSRLFWNPIVLQKCDAVPIPLKIKIGSALLKAGRFWGLPFALSNNAIVSKKFPLNFERCMED